MSERYVIRDTEEGTLFILNENFKTEADVHKEYNRTFFRILGKASDVKSGIVLDKKALKKLAKKLTKKHKKAENNEN